MPNDEIEIKRQTAAYADTLNRLRATREDLSDAEIEQLALAAVDAAVFGFDAKKDRNGNFIQQGMGSKGHETVNHFASIRRWEGQAAYDKAVREIYGRDPDRARKLGLPQPARI